MAATGVLASMQPYHAADDGRWAAKRIREPQLRGTYAFRSILDAGGTLVFGSDWYVAPVDPLLGIWAAVSRQTMDGANPEGWYPEQRITVEEALRAYTLTSSPERASATSCGRSGWLSVDVATCTEPCVMIRRSSLPERRSRLRQVE
jgi:predicted amidohydrolase YtcJ